jgi:Methyltransferase domain
VSRATWALETTNPAHCPRRESSRSPIVPFMPQPLSRCCAAATTRSSVGQSLAVLRCRRCGTVWGEHSLDREGRPWDESYVPGPFAEALRRRREQQANQLLRVIKDAGCQEPILDYGIGQGVFLRELVTNGLDAWGCDIDAEVPFSVAPPDRTIHLDKPWSIPCGGWRTIVMLDVLEHHPDPGSFLRSLPSQDVLLKVPTATGPFASAARLLARAGKPAALAQLFLDGENFPHQWLCTRGGLRSIANAAGWDVVMVRPMVEVGRELAVRSRLSTPAWLRPALTLSGVAVGALGRWWSDAAVVHLRRPIQ